MIDSKYGQVTLKKKPSAPKDEPCFVLRAQDELAAGVVRYYAFLYLQATRDARGCMGILDQSEAFDKWPTKKLPD